MPVLLYCVTRTGAEPIQSLVGISDQPVRAHDAADLRIYWSDISDPETLLAEGAVRKAAEAKFQQVLREIVVQVTPIPFRFSCGACRC